MNTYNVVTMKGDRLKMPPVKNFHVLMEFPWLPDFAKWLLKVVEAEELWFEVRQAELFAQNFPHLVTFPDPQLHDCALAVVSALQDQEMMDGEADDAFVYAIDFSFCKARGFETEFILLKELGSLTVFENFYRTAIPKSIDRCLVKIVFHRVAYHHLDEEGKLSANSPGILYMPKAEAEAKAEWWRAQ